MLPYAGRSEPCLRNVSRRSASISYSCIPPLVAPIARADEHRRLLARVGVEDEDALRLVEPRHVKQIRVLPVFVIDVVVSRVDGGRGENGYRIVSADRHRVAESRTAPGVELTVAS